MWQAAVQLQIGSKRNEERLDEVMKLATQALMSSSCKTSSPHYNSKNA